MATHHIPPREARLCREGLSGSQEQAQALVGGHGLGTKGVLVEEPRASEPLAGASGMEGARRLFQRTYTKHSQSVTHSGKKFKTACLLHFQYFYDYSIRGMSRQWFTGDSVFCPLLKTVVRTHVSGSPPGVKTIESTIYIYPSLAVQDLIATF